MTIRRPLFIALICLVSAPARAQVIHRLEEGESLAKVARRYYGASWKWSYVAAVNGIEDPKKVPPGRKLKIPVVWPYTVRRGDRLYTVADKLLGDGKRYPFLARFNGLSEKAVLSRGQRLWIPIQIRHRVARGETLSKLGRRYYRNARMRYLLRDYNFLKSMRLEPGQVVLVPIFDREATLERVQARIREARRRPPARAGGATAPAVAPARAKASATAPRGGDSAGGEDAPPAARAARSPPPPAPEGPDEAELERRLGEAEGMLRDGEYEDALEELLELARLAREARPERRARIHKNLAVTYVALGRRGEAVDAFRRMLEAVPDATLDPVSTSPKVLEVFQQARGAE